MHRLRWRVAAFVVAMSLAVGYAATLLTPQRYLATGGVLLQTGMQKMQYIAEDPAAAAAAVREFIARHAEPLLVDPPIVVPLAPSLGVNLAVAAALGVLLGLPFFYRRKSSPMRSENELNQVLGEPLLAARPLASHELARQLLANWFGRGRRVLAVVSAEDDDERTRVTAELARALAASGAPTLLVDADMRAPRLHRAFALANRAGLADFLERRPTRLVRCAENLTVLVAGRARTDPLELLSRRRMRKFLAAAAKRYAAVLVETPAAARGPDLQLFAAFAGGALVVVKRRQEAGALQRVRRLLDASKACVVGAVLSAS
jgi:Mrp family chromosome partitioning ATPase